MPKHYLECEHCGVHLDGGDDVVWIDMTGAEDEDEQVKEPYCVTCARELSNNHQ